MSHLRSTSATTAEPTLLVFTLGARREERRRRLLPAALGAEERELHRSCLEEALGAGRANGCRLKVCSPARVELPAGCERLSQSGKGFGERLAVAMARARGEGPLVVVGSDVPDLGSSHVAEALEILAGGERRAVLGPSPDGGVYLLAASGPIEEAFGEVRWRSGATRRTLVRALERAGWEVVLLEPLADLDRRADLEGWLARSRVLQRAFARLRRRLRASLAALRRPRPEPRPMRSGARFAPAVSGRAPPL